uniref:Slit homolog 3 protein n=1 Tax=Phallusia mammillata TaxID=59560 RepID=A0A6F9DTR4_9ASCI|nr:slit homolog 3 protein [Phallusia mammillata]
MDVNCYMLLCAFTLMCFTNGVHGSSSSTRVVLDNGCTITRGNDGTTMVQIDNMPLPHLNCSEVHLTRFTVNENVADIKSITLSHNDLIDFHVDDLLPFSALEKILLDNNKIARVVPAQSNPQMAITSLNYLSLAHNQITEISKSALKSFPNLKYLTLLDNSIKAVRFDDFIYNTKLQALDLGQNTIEYFQKGWVQNMSLTTLGLRSCGLTRLPTPVSSMSSLVDLDVSLNKLSYLESDSFRYCAQLRRVDLSSNMIQDIDPLAFKGAYNLKKIELSDNFISTIPTPAFDDQKKESVEIELYANPMTCDCTNSWLTGWYDQLNGATPPLNFECKQPLRNHGKRSRQLKGADFVCKVDDELWQDCSGGEPTTVQTATSLDDAALCPQGCTCYDEEGSKYGHPSGVVSQSTTRKRIDGFLIKESSPLSVICTGVGLTRIPVENIRSDAKIIALSDNKITTLDLHQLAKFTNLVELDLRKNGIKQLISDPELVLPNVRLLNLRYNNLTSITRLHLKSFPNLNVLAIYHNAINHFPSDLLLSNRKLRRLYIGPNPVQNFKSDFLRGLDIYKMSLQNLSLTSVPVEIRTMKNLEFLNLNDNRITTLPNNTFSGCTSLYRIVLENNQISTVETNAFNGANQLLWIFLSENNIRTLPPGVFENVSPVGLVAKLWANPIVCDCKLRWFKTWIEQAKARDPTTDIRFICSAPSQLYNKKSNDLAPQDFVCDGNGSSMDLCQVCEVTSGTVGLAVVLTFLTTAMLCYVAWRVKFGSRYGNLLPYAKQKDLDLLTEVST